MITDLITSMCGNTSTVITGKNRWFFVGGPIASGVLMKIVVNFTAKSILKWNKLLKKVKTLNDIYLFTFWFYYKFILFFVCCPGGSTLSVFHQMQLFDEFYTIIILINAYNGFVSHQKMN